MRCWIAGAAVVLSLVSARAQSQEVNAAAPFGMPMDDNRVFAHLLVDQFEARLGADDAYRWDAQGWVGSDENRLYVLTEGEAGNGVVTDAQHELLYDRPVTPFFDLQAGVREDLDSARNRTWAAFGVAGLAPYFLELSATLYASDTGHYALRGLASYDLLLTQRLVLTPTVELNVYSKVDPPRAIDSGLSDIEAGIRLRYEITRKFAPYLGVSYQRNVSPVATLNETRVALGLHAWL